ncbi:hypothetical protein PLEOSDRAFT_169861 [Pleurotus ostreatus PC15]|uniref:Uncharacterized protein n=1 Tax=Pleurotus ostreatus (strain PC15) TaxID=1137138 RepID=A0A067NDX3_PLEO1|nr:hypothetical protein PLEOSDRAFT_169861 [Pleurotus ostreatus PC15]
MRVTFLLAAFAAVAFAAPAPVQDVQDGGISGFDAAKAIGGACLNALKCSIVKKVKSAYLEVSRLAAEEHLSGQSSRWIYVIDYEWMDVYGRTIPGERDIGAQGLRKGLSGAPLSVTFKGIERTFSSANFRRRSARSSQQQWMEMKKTPEPATSSRLNSDPLSIGREIDRKRVGYPIIKEGGVVAD